MSNASVGLELYQLGVHTRAKNNILKQGAKLCKFKFIKDSEKHLLLTTMEIMTFNCESVEAAHFQGFITFVPEVDWQIILDFFRKICLKLFARASSRHNFAKLTLK